MRQITLQKHVADKAAWLLSTVGYVVVKDGTKNVLVTHGRADGSMPFLKDVFEWGIAFDEVVCCYPQQVQKANPTLKVWGNWTCRTKISFGPTGGFLFLSETEFNSRKAQSVQG